MSSKPTPRPLVSPPATGDARTDALAELIAVVDRLRDPRDGCPWDLEQTLASLAPSAIEEAHELVEAVERGDEEGALEETGDVLMLVVLLAKIASQTGRFDLAQVASGVSAKLVRRHPHVFGSAQVDGARGAIEGWERIKQGEREGGGKADTSALAGVPLALPALQRAHRVGAKAIAAGFRWTDARGALAKLDEEQGELREAFEAAGLAADARAAPDADARARIADELGDVLLAGALFGNYLELDPEALLRAAVRRFEARFRAMEAELGGSVRGQPLERLSAAWERAKRAEAC